MSNAASLPLEEKIVATLRHLPPASQAEVLDFAQFLSQRQQMAPGLRPYGLCAGEFVVPRDFDAPLARGGVAAVRVMITGLRRATVRLISARHATRQERRHDEIRWK